jgi:hypothetical protein
MLMDCGFIVTDTILAGERAIFHAELDPAPTAGYKLRMAYGLRYG